MKKFLFVGGGQIDCGNFYSSTLGMGILRGGEEFKLVGGGSVEGLSRGSVVKNLGQGIYKSAPRYSTGVSRRE